MKVTPGNNAELNLNKKVDKSSRNDLDANSGGDVSEGVGEKLDFATVLDRVTKSRDQTHSRSEEHNAHAPTSASGKKTIGDDHDTEQNVGGGTTGGGEVASPVRVEAPSEATSILHVSDLEKIIEACKVQVAPGGQTEVVLDLSRSMLEGLRVKVRTDGAGRVAAEFLAANEGIKSLLDSRSAELIALLRARGINLTEFKSAVTADANSGGNNPEQQFRQQAAAASPGGGRLDDRSAIEPSSDGPDETASGATYRA